MIQPKEATQRVSTHPGSRMVRRHLERLSGESYKDAKNDWLLVSFIAHGFRRPRCRTRLNWSKHRGKCSMHAKIGRCPGEEDAEHHVRAEMAAGWKSHFTQDCVQTSSRHADEVLTSLGYEEDSRSVDRESS